MKLRIGIVFLWIFFFGGLEMFSQQFSPGQDGKAYLNMQDVNVNYNTGIMSFKVPLFGIKVEDLQLKSYLNYTASGIKYDDVSSVCGNGWNIVCGGIVTRELRGSFADELENGHIFTPIISTTNTTDYIEKVNKRMIDGESDIFTAVCNGQKVQFIIEKEGNTIVAVPFQKSNFKIECEAINYYDRFDIKSWTITDGSGVKYVFDQIEETNRAFSESSNTEHAYNERFISSWKPSRIISSNGKEICFQYKGIGEVIYRQTTDISYNYGRDMIEYNFDLSPVRDEVNKYINDFNVFAKESNAKLLTILNSSQLDLSHIEYPGWSNQLDALVVLRKSLFDQVNSVTNIMGVVNYLSQISYTNNKVINLLDKLISAISASSLPHKYSMVGCLERIKYLIIGAGGTPTIYSEKDNYHINAYAVNSLQLSRVFCNNKMLSFKYRGDRYSVYNHEVDRRLENIVEQNILSDTVSIIDFKYSGSSYLTRLSFLNVNGNEKTFLDFDYYGMGEEVNNKDLWGYYFSGEQQFDASYYEWLINNLSNIDWKYVDSISVKHKTLKSVKNCLGAKMFFDFEPNEVLRYGKKFKYGGLRVKTIISDDGTQQDTIRYNYLNSGVLCSNDLNVTDILEYGYFSDVVRKNSISFNPYIVLNKGNNGLFYRYVEENSRNGKTAYKYFVVSEYTDIERASNYHYTYPYWLQGCLEMKAIYDKLGNLKQLEQYSYTINTRDYDPFITDNPLVEFTQDFKLVNSLKKPQINASSYYLDIIKLSSIFTGQVDPVFGINPSQIYKTNYKPRANLKNPNNYKYNLIMGVDINIAAKQTYLPKNPNLKISLNDDINFNEDFYCVGETLYEHAGLNHSYPSKVTTISSRGDSLIQLIKYPLDYSHINDENINVLISKNIVNVPLNLQYWKKTADKNLLINEKVNVFSDIINGTDTISFLSSEYELDNLSPIRDAIECLKFENSEGIFSDNISKYRAIKKYKYSKSIYPFNVEEIYNNGNTDVIISDKISGNILFKCSNIARESICAIDNSKYSSYNYMPGYLTISEILAGMDAFYKECVLNKNSHDYERYNNKKLLYWYIETSKEMLNRIAFKENMHYLDSIKNTTDFFELNASALENPDYTNILFEFYRWCYDITHGLANYNSAILSQYVLEQDFQVKAIDKINKYRILIKGNPDGNKYKIKYKSGSYSTSKILLFRPVGDFYTALIDISTERDVESIEYIGVESPKYILDKYQTVYMFPANISFEANSYDTFGKLTHKINENLNIESYHYDEFDRLKYVKDSKGNIIKKLEYKLWN